MLHIGKYNKLDIIRSLCVCVFAVWFSSASKDDSETCSLDAANLTAVVEVDYRSNRKAALTCT